MIEYWESIHALLIERKVRVNISPRMQFPVKILCRKFMRPN